MRLVVKRFHLGKLLQRLAHGVYANTDFGGLELHAHISAASFYLLAAAVARRTEPDKPHRAAAVAFKPGHGVFVAGTAFSWRGSAVKQPDGADRPHKQAVD